MRLGLQGLRLCSTVVGGALANLFIPSGSSRFITSDGDTFTVGDE